MNRFTWVNPSSLEAAIAALGDKALAKAGGIDVMDRLKERLDRPERVVNLRALGGLDEIREDDRALRVGALATLAQIAEHPAVKARYRALADAAGSAATPQIRNMATLGGNLLQRPRCWYFRSESFVCKKKGGGQCFALEGVNTYHAIFDNQVCAAVHPSAAATALVALGASVRLAGPEGAREVPLASFFVTPDKDVMRESAIGPQEVLTEIVVPRSGARSAYLKQGEKASFDWPLAEVAVALEQQGERCTRAVVVLGAAGPVPRRAAKSEAALVGKRIDEAAASAAARAALEGATPLAHNGYKLPLFRAIIRRAILAAAGSHA